MKRRDFLKNSAALATVAAAHDLSTSIGAGSEPRRPNTGLETSEKPRLKPSHQWRVVMNDDGWNQFGGNTTAEMLRERVDYNANAGVDVLAWCTSTPDLCLYPTKVGEWLGSADRPAGVTSGNVWNRAYNLRKLVEAGNDPVDVLAARCHDHGMPFVGAIRMNDIHHIYGYDHASNITKFLLDHLDWCIRNGSGKIIGGMDYAIDPVRDHRLAIMREQMERYDLDGLELDFMRMPPFFQPGRASQDAPIMTAFLHRIRRMIDEVARDKKQSRPILGARVPTTVGRCQQLGLDLESWLNAGLIDYVCPSDFSRADFNIPVEEFVRLTEGTSCRIFPTVHPNVNAQYDQEQRLTLERYRGFAHNMFRFGADGISTFNFMMGKFGTWHNQRHIGGWDMMKEIHDPESLASRNRTYFYDHSISQDRAIVLDRTKDVGKRQAVSFRVAEDFADNRWKRVLRFKPIDLSVADRIRFDINGQAVTEQLRGDFLFEMSDPPNSARYAMDLADSPARYGDNEFGVTLVETNPDLKKWTPDYLGHEQSLPVKPIRITELEILVTRA